MRLPAVAGSFYASTEELLVKQIKGCYLYELGTGKLPKYNEKGLRKIKGAVVPHAGYMYSGATAAWVYAALAEDRFPATFIIIGPNHTGYGSGIAITKETFSTPLGEAEIDLELADALLNTIIDNDFNAHRYEHSIEVQLPFLQFIKRDFKFVPLCLGIQDYKTAKEVGSIIKKAIFELKKDVVVIASSDFTHYEERSEAERKDKLAIEKILNLDAKGLYEVVNRYSISMCGYGPVMAMLESIDAKKATLLKYCTSGDIEKHMLEVVGYAGIVVE
ncbi:MAG: MEMO1 family protein [Candidatus Thermoplasmatota archaeon]|nr:MEMO1 family protein [Candidatus Thermoplasmatota archaeon]